MQKLDFSPKIVKLCRILNNVIHAKVKIGKQLSSEFKVNQSLRHGDAISPLLFKVLENAIRSSKVESLGTTSGKYRQIIAYADNVVIMRRILQDVEEVFTSLVEKTGKMKIEINK
jgi:hypothetical protein